MKHIVITGGSDGIGKALATDLIREYRVTILARDNSKLKELSERIGCNYYVCDIRNPDQVSSVFDQIRSQYGAVDVLINNAGVIVNGDLTNTPYKDIESVMTTNALGTIYVTKACLEIMKPERSGLIINVISTAGITAKPNRSVYNASKWAVTGFTKAIQEEAGSYGVRVTGFYPGTVKTELFNKAGLSINGPALETAQIVKTIRFVLDLEDNTIVPEIGIRPFDA